MEKEDPNKQYIWLKIEDDEEITWLATCYFAPKSSKFYKKRYLNNKDPFATLRKDVLSFNQIGNTILLGDFNARTMSNQAIQLGNDLTKDNNPLWLKKDDDNINKHTSQDEKGVVSHFVAELLGLCSYV